MPMSDKSGRRNHGNSSLQSRIITLAALLSMLVANGVQAQSPSSTVVGDLLNSITGLPTLSAVQAPVTSEASIFTPTPSPVPDSSPATQSSIILPSPSASSSASGRIWSTRYTIHFPYTPSSSAISTSSSSSAAVPINQVSPIYSVSQLPSLQLATVTDIWWSPVIGQGGPGIPVRENVRPWGKYDRVVVAHAVVGSLAWLIISPLAIILARIFKSTEISSSSAFFAAHQWLQTILTLLLTLVAVILGGIATNNDITGGSHFQSAHQRMGLVLIILLVLQILLGRRLSKNHKATLEHGLSRGSIAHIGLGVTLTAIGFAQIYLGFSLYERKSSRKVPVAVKAIWAVIVGLFSIYLIALAVRSRLPSQQSKVKAQRRKAQIYSPRPDRDSSTSWENIMAGSAAAESTSTFGIRSTTPEMQERRDYESTFTSSPTPASGQPRSIGRMPESPKPFSSLAESQTGRKVSPSRPPKAHFSSYNPAAADPFASPSTSLALPVSHTAPLSSSSGMRALPAVSEEGLNNDAISFGNTTSSSRADSPMPPLSQPRGSVTSIKRKAVPSFLE